MNERKYQENPCYKQWLKMYRKGFNNLREFRSFAERCLNNGDNRARRMLNYGGRFLALADQSHRLVRARPTFQIFFLVICAEALYRLLHKLHYKRGISQKAALEFCNGHFSPQDKKLLINCFRKGRVRGAQSNDVKFKDVIAHFYEIRCRLVHEGNYWDFAWASASADRVNPKIGPDGEKLELDDLTVCAGTTYEKLRPAFVRAIINAVKDVMPAQDGERQNS